MRLPLVATLALLITAALAPAAGAAVVSIERSDDIVYVNVLGGPEADVLTMSSPSPGRFTVTQAPGRPLTTSGDRCFAAGAGRVDCLADAAGALVVGGEGDDRLAVSGAVGLGAWLYGSGGADTLTGGPGADRLDGGAGTDLLSAVDGRGDWLFCGADADRYDADAIDAVAGDCERRPEAAPPAAPPVPSPGPAPAAPAPLPAGPPPVDVVSGTVTMSRGAVPLRVQCAAAARCLGWITVRLLPRHSAKATAARARRPVIAKRRYRLAPGETKSLRAQISRRGRQRVLERRRARCSVRVSTVGADGTKQTTESKITIEAGDRR